jgi:hypothetical protein
VGGDIWIFIGRGGRRPSRHTCRCPSLLCTPSRPLTNANSKQPGRLNTGRSDACAIALDGKIYVLGGWSKNYASMLGGEVLDPSTGQWRALPAGMVERGDCEAAALPDCVFVVGGWGPEDFSNVAECYQPSTGTWKRMANMTNARGAKGGIGFGRRLAS